MNMTYLITGVVLLVWLVLVWILGSALQLKSPDIWVLRGGLALIGIGAAAAFLWWKRGRTAAGGGAEPVDASNEIDILIRDTEARLAASRISKGSRIANFPLVLLLGETGSAKTSILVSSGLDPELLAGQVYQDNKIVPTRLANLWFSRNTIFVEGAARLLGDNGLWHRAIRRIRGGANAAPRAAVVCFDAERFTQAGAADSTSAAARWYDSPAV
jgi:type VI secretion system protein ImpL